MRLIITITFDTRKSKSIDFGSSRSDDLKSSDIRLALGAIAEAEDYPIQLKVSLQQGLPSFTLRTVSAMPGAIFSSQLVLLIFSK